MTLFFLFSVVAWGSSTTDSYRHLSGSCQPVTESDIQALNSTRPDCQLGSTGKSQSDLTNVADRIVDNVLATTQSENLSCAIQTTETYSNVHDSGLELQKLTVADIGSKISYMRNLKADMQRLTNENQILLGQIPKNEGMVPKVGSKEYNAAIQYAENNRVARESMQKYAATLSTIWQHDNPEMQAWIDGYVSSSQFNEENFYAEAMMGRGSQSFESLRGRIKENLKKSKKQLDSQQRGPGNYQLDSATREELYENQNLLQSIVKKNPNAVKSLEAATCKYQSNKQLKEGLILGASVGSMLFPATWFGTFMAARAAFALNTARAAKLAQASKLLGLGTMLVGSTATMESFVKSCLNESPDLQVGADSCQSSKDFEIAKMKTSNCLLDSTLAASGAVGGSTLSYLAKRRQDTAEFVQRMQKSLRSQEPAFAGNLTNGERIAAAEGILGRTLNSQQRDALIRAHEVGNPPYTAKQIEEKRRIMTQAGIGWRDREFLLWKNITGRYGNEADVGRRMSDLRLSSSGARSFEQNQAREKLLTDYKKFLDDGGDVSATKQEIADWQRRFFAAGIPSTAADKEINYLKKESWVTEYQELLAANKIKLNDNSIIRLGAERLMNRASQEDSALNNLATQMFQKEAALVEARSNKGSREYFDLYVAQARIASDETAAKTAAKSFASHVTAEASKDRSDKAVLAETLLKDQARVASQVNKTFQERICLFVREANKEFGTRVSCP
ncbi:MAG: hypothetical protein ACAH59_04350 [Pseudobdellovibrionaceae bacterium]